MNFKIIFKSLIIFILVIGVIIGAFFITGIIIAKKDAKNLTNLSYQIIELTKNWWLLPKEKGGFDGETVTEIVERFIAEIKDPAVYDTLMENLEAGVSKHILIFMTSEFSDMIDYINENIHPSGDTALKINGYHTGAKGYGPPIGNKQGKFNIVLDPDNQDLLLLIGAKYSLTHYISVLHSFDPNDNELNMELEINKTSIWRYDEHLIRDEY